MAGFVTPDFTTKLRAAHMQNPKVTCREAVTFREVRIFAAMKATEDEVFVSKEACAGSMRNILDAMYVLNGKWKIPLILCLTQSPRRFNELRNEMNGISPKVLANELRDLELNEFIIRTVYPTTPETIMYEATDYSRSLRNVMHELSSWGALHRERIKASMRK